MAFIRMPFLVLLKYSSRGLHLIFSLLNICAVSLFSYSSELPAMAKLLDQVRIHMVELNKIVILFNSNCYTLSM
jgi:hypothetical protein